MRISKMKETGDSNASGKIELNTYYLDDDTAAQKTETCTHELGHALGLDHCPSKEDIMYASQTSVNKLSQNDKDSYDEAYKNY